MPECYLLLREHEAGQGIPKEHSLKLSSTTEELTYAVILKTSLSKKKQTIIISEDQSSDPDCQALIHSQNGIVYLEALKPDLAVQCYATSFGGVNANGHMPLKQSKPDHRVFFQLHPRESLFIGSKTLTIKPHEFSSPTQEQPTQNAPVLPNANEGQEPQTQGSQMAEVAPQRSVSAEQDVQMADLYDLNGPNGTHPMLSNTIQTLNSDRPSPVHLDAAGNAWSMQQFCSREFKVSRDVKEEQDFSESTKPLLQRHPVSPSQVGEISTVVTTESPSAMNASFIESSDLSYTLVEPVTSGTDEVEQPEEDGPNVQNAALEHDHRVFDSRSRSPILSKPESQSNVSCSYSALQNSGTDTQGSMLSCVVVKSEEISTTGCEHDPKTPSTQQQVEVMDKPLLSCHNEQTEIESPSSLRAISSPIRSTRSSSRKDDIDEDHTKDGPRVLFASSTSIDASIPYQRFLEAKGVRRVSNIEECTHLCISKSEGIKKTVKFVTAVLLGRQIIWYTWITESVKAKKLLDIECFSARDHKRESEWGVNLDEAIGRGRAGERPFSGWTFVFTPSAKEDAGRSGYRDLVRIINSAGAKKCTSVLPKEGPAKDELILVIASAKDPTLATIKKRWRCFDREIIALSALRGSLDTSSDEFLVADGPASGGEARRNRKRKR